MDDYLSNLATECINEETKHIDSCSTEEMVELINRQDAMVAGAVEQEKHHIAEAVDLISEKLRMGGRLIYLGAGTSGRLGVLDASECLPTFGVGPDQIQGYIAGGDSALRFPVEGCEDKIGRAHV
jgi:N-acetylmuramic acid 6-phosphate etherase